MVLLVVLSAVVLVVLFAVVLVVLLAVLLAAPHVALLRRLVPPLQPPLRSVGSTSLLGMSVRRPSRLVLPVSLAG